MPPNETDCGTLSIQRARRGGDDAPGVGVVALNSPTAAAAKGCGRVFVPSVGLRAKVRVVRGPMVCRVADRPFCRRAGRQVDRSFRRDDGWRF